MRGIGLAALLLAATGGACAAAEAQEFDQDGWRTVSREDLAMNSEPLAPGAPAIYLYYQYDRDDPLSQEKEYAQVKVLSEAGREYANVEIQYDRHGQAIRDIQARVIQPDGTIVPFTGTIYDQPVVSSHNLRLHSRTFTLPDVRVGSIIEYRFLRRLDSDWLYNSNWVLSRNLFTRLERHRLAMYPGKNVRWSWPNGLPEGTSPPVRDGRKLTHEARNVPAFITESFMPPAADLKYYVEFQYINGVPWETDPNLYWKQVGREDFQRDERFAMVTRPLRKALDAIVAPGDDAARKVRKIYDHVQKMRNTLEDSDLTSEEIRRKHERRPLNADEVAEFGYGDSKALLNYFMALVRAAGVPASPVLTGNRGSRLFNRNRFDASQLMYSVVAVTLDGKDVLLDPLNHFLPFGELGWSDTAVPALKLDKDGGNWITMPSPTPDEAEFAYSAKFSMSEAGELQGTVHASYRGREALWRRERGYDTDVQARREFLKSDLKDEFASPAEVELIGEPDWTGVGTPFEVDYRVKVPQWAVVSGDRIMLGLGVLGAHVQGLFVAPKRERQIYFSYPTRREDDVEITLPAGYRVAAAPPNEPGAREGGLAYSISTEVHDGRLAIHREFSVNVVLAKVETYPAFRAFYEAVRAGDAQQLVLAR